MSNDIIYDDINNKLLMHATGTGKTLLSIKRAFHLFFNNHVTSVLFLVNTNLVKENVENEIERIKKFNISEDNTADKYLNMRDIYTSKDNNFKQKLSEFFNHFKIEMVQTIYGMLTTTRLKAGYNNNNLVDVPTSNSSLYEKLKRLDQILDKDTFVILDEAHMLRNWPKYCIPDKEIFKRCRFVQPEDGGDVSAKTLMGYPAVFLKKRATFSIKLRSLDERSMSIINNDDVTFPDMISSAFVLKKYSGSYKCWYSNWLEQQAMGIDTFFEWLPLASGKVFIFCTEKDMMWLSNDRFIKRKLWCMQHVTFFCTNLNKKAPTVADVYYAWNNTHEDVFQKISPKYFLKRNIKSDANENDEGTGVGHSKVGGYWNALLVVLAYAKNAWFLSATPLYSHPDHLCNLLYVLKRVVGKGTRAFHLLHQSTNELCTSATAPCVPNITFKGDAGMTGTLQHALDTYVSFKDHSSAGMPTSKTRLVLIPMDQVHTKHLYLQTISNAKSLHRTAWDGTLARGTNIGFGKTTPLTNKKLNYIDNTIQQNITSKESNTVYKAVLFCRYNLKSYAGKRFIEEALLRKNWTMYDPKAHITQKEKEYSRSSTGSTKYIFVITKSNYSEYMNTFSQSVVVDASAMLLVCTLDMAGEGVSLQSVRDVFIYDLPWSTQKAKQAVARAVRKNSNIHTGRQKVDVETHLLVLADPKWMDQVEVEVEPSTLPAMSNIYKPTTTITHKYSVVTTDVVYMTMKLANTDHAPKGIPQIELVYIQKGVHITRIDTQTTENAAETIKQQIKNCTIITAACKKVMRVLSKQLGIEVKYVDVVSEYNQKYSIATKYTYQPCHKYMVDDDNNNKLDIVSKKWDKLMKDHKNLKYRIYTIVPVASETRAGRRRVAQKVTHFLTRYHMFGGRMMVTACCNSQTSKL